MVIFAKTIKNLKDTGLGTILRKHPLDCDKNHIKPKI